MEKENIINVLDEINKGACMGVDAISNILDKIEDEELKKILEEQLNNYKMINDKIAHEYLKYSSKDPHETNVVNKTMTWLMEEMKTLNDTSNSKIAELIIQGTNMGIIEGRRILNNNDLDDKVKQIVETYVIDQEKMIENLKTFL